MRKILDIAINDLRVFFREPGQFIGLLIIPLIVTVGVGVGTGGLGNGPQQALVDVLNTDNSPYAEQFIANLREANSGLILCPLDDRENSCKLDEAKTLDVISADERLTDKVTDAIIEIPAGFGEKAQAGQPATIIYRSRDTAGSSSFVLQAVQAAAGKLGSAQVATIVGLNVADHFAVLKFADDTDRAAFAKSVSDSAMQLLNQNLVTINFTLTEQKQEDSKPLVGTQAGFGQSVPGMGSMFVMFTVFGGLYALIRERNNWTLQRLVMMPLSKGQILAGKILAWFCIGMLQFAAVFVIGLIVRINFGDQPLALLVVMIAFSLCITALTFAVSTLMKTEIQANSVSLLMALTLAPLGGAWWPLDIVPEFMRTIGHLSPVAWATDSFRMLIFEKGTLLTVLPNIAMLLVLTTVFFAFAVRRFKYE